MKKSILSLIAGVVVALASCSQADEMPGQPQEDGQLVTFNIQTPAATRAAVTDLTRYIVEAYEGSSATGTPATRVEAATGTLVVKLNTNTEYTFLFWADKGTAKAGSTPSSGYWDTADLKAVKVTSNKIGEKGEVAYCLATTLNSADLGSSNAVTLKNATAQVNFVTTEALTAGSNILIVSYPESAKLNVGTGEVTNATGTANHTFTGIGTVASGGTLATDYILAPLKEQRLIELVIQFNSQDQMRINNVPFQQCYKTNIRGKYTTPPTPPTTDNFTFTITADDTWENSDKDYDLTETGWDGTYPADVATAKQWLGTESSGGNETDGKNHVFNISTAKQLCAMHTLLDQTMTGASTNVTYAKATYKLTTDINLNNHPWTPMGIHSTVTAISGVFDGQGHSILGLNISEFTGNHVYTGLFSSNKGTIKHLTVKGNVESDETGNNVGGIVGLNEGTIAFCSFEGTVKATKADATNRACFGWICGRNIYWKSQSGGNIISCFAKGAISSASSAVVMGGITGANADEGNSGTVSGCTWYYKSGATPEGIEKCYPEWTSGGSDTNASYSDNTTLAGRVSTMNTSYSFSNNFEWEASGSTLKLVPKSTPN